MKVESYTGSAGGKGSANITRNILKFGGTGIKAKRGRTLVASEVDGSYPRVRVIDVIGKVRGYSNAASGSKHSVSPVFAY